MWNCQYKVNGRLPLCLDVSLTHGTTPITGVHVHVGQENRNLLELLETQNTFITAHVNSKLATVHFRLLIQTFFMFLKMYLQQEDFNILFGFNFGKGKNPNF